MATYPYTNDQGDEIEVIGSMTNPPPEHILVDDEGNWCPVADEVLVKTLSECTVWRRIYGAGLGVSVPNYVCKPGKGGLPVSVASPRKKGGKPRKVGGHTVMEHSDGTITNTVGQPIIDSNKAAKENAARTGMELD